jgi:hypothetical protein
LKNTGNLFYDFLTGLNSNFNLPDKIDFINPYTSAGVKTVLKEFCDKYYSSKRKRVLVLGINVGRFGGGITGIPFTDPVALFEVCDIPNSFDKRTELSSRFIYEMINNFGGVKKFYDKFLLSAVCPLGFIKEEKNYNYYDSVGLSLAVNDLIKNSLQCHSEFNVQSDVVVSFGKKNADHLKRFNEEMKLFKKIIVLEHPRYIMQYKLSKKSDYIQSFCEVFNDIKV